MPGWYRMEFVLGIIYIMVAGAVLVSMVALYLLGPDKQYKKIYLVCQAAVVVWCVSQIFLLLSSDTIELAVAYVFGNLGICSIGALWYYFACLYTNRKMSTAGKALPAVAASVHYIGVITNPLHHIFYKSFDIGRVTRGPMFYTNVFATYFFVVAGSVILYMNLTADKIGDSGVDSENDTNEDSVKSDRARNGQLLIVASVLIPVFLNIVYLSKLFMLTFDITPLGFGISVILVMLATMKYNFMDVHRELAITNEKLLLEKERNRIAQQVHDTAGHTLTMIQSYMKLAEISNEKGENSETGTYLSEARTLTSNGIRELREAINEMKKGESYELVTKGIMQLAGQVKEIPVEVTVKGEDSEKYSHLSKVLYDCTRESITNTLKYANASKMEIVIKFKENSVDLIISDDGDGCDEIKDNNGLLGIKERVKKAGGTVRFISEKDEGFLTRINVAVKKGIF